MTATPEQVDVARALALLAGKLDPLPAKLRAYASGLITAWASPEQADALAAVLEETARQVRLNRPKFTVDGETTPDVPRLDHLMEPPPPPPPVD